MNTKLISFPHPVLGISDDVSGNMSLSIKIKRSPEKKTVCFFIEAFEIGNEYFKTLVRDKRAAVLFKVYCSSTMMTWSFLNPIDFFEIAESDLCNKIDIDPCIVSTDQISDYSSETFNFDYEGLSFNVNKFEVIAILGSLTLPIDKNYEQLSLGNIFNFCPVEDHTKPCSFQFTSDKIVVRYPVTIDGAHTATALFHDVPWTAFNIFIIPALTEAFRLLSDKDDAQTTEGLEWRFVLDQLLPESDRDSDPFTNAQLLLNREIPILKSYQEICKSN